MQGIPVTITRNEDEAIIYLSTRRSGAAGKAMKSLKHRFHQAIHAASKANSRVFLIMTKAEGLDAEAEDYADVVAELHEKQTDAAASALKWKEEALEHAEDLVRRSLKENHGPDTTDIMDCLTDKQLQQMVTIIETGDTPEDFFPSNGTRPKQSTTLPLGDTPGESSAEQDTAEPTSTPGESE